MTGMVALSDAELNDFQVKYFNAPLQPSEIVGVKRVVGEKLQEGVDTLTGFLFLHALFIEKGRLETTWTVLRKFGYNNEIKLRDDQFPTPIKRSADQIRDFIRALFPDRECFTLVRPLSNENDLQRLDQIAVIIYETHCGSLSQ